MYFLSAIPLPDEDTAVDDGGITIRDPDSSSTGSSQSGQSSNGGSLPNETSPGTRVVGSLALAMLSRGFVLALGLAVF